VVVNLILDGNYILTVSQNILTELAAKIALPSSKESKEQVVKKIVVGVRFEMFIQALVTTFHNKAIETLKVLDSGQPNFNHNFIANLAAHELCPFVLTTNFDSLLERALANSGIDEFELWHFNSHYRQRLIDTNTPFRILKLHGSLRDRRGKESYRSIAIAANQVGKSIPSPKRKAIRNILKTYDIVFVGYSGLDDFDLLPLILTTKSERSVYWLDHRETERMVYRYSEELQNRGKTVPKSNPERIVASRNNSILISGSTYQFISFLSESLFGTQPTEPRKNKNKGDFSYLTEWENKIELHKHQHLANGLLFQILEDNKEAIRFFSFITPESPDIEKALYFKAISLRRDNQVTPAREQLIELAQGRRWSKNIRMNALVELGLLETERTNFELARSHLNRALRMKPEDDSIVVNAHNNLGMSYLIEAERFKLSDNTTSRVTKTIKKAVNHFRRAQQLVGKYGNPRVLANICGNIGLAYVVQKHFDLAKKNLFEAQRLFKSLFVASEEAASLGNIGYYYKERALSLTTNEQKYREYLEVALQHNEQSHGIHIRASTPRRIAFTKHNIGEIYYLLGKFKEAIHWLTLSKQILEDEGLSCYAEDVSRAMERAQMSSSVDQSS
jgi:tetratricopeptide (TPR) repeat protein